MKNTQRRRILGQGAALLGLASGLSSGLAGAPPAQMALVAGQMDFNFDNLAAASANIRAGLSFDVGTWSGLFGSAGLGADTTRRLNQAFVDALKSSEVAARVE